MNINKEEEVNPIRKEHEFDELQKEGPSIGTQTTLLNPEQIEEFFNAAENGSIERLEQLFGEKMDADPNMTYFAESLLMAAIRTGQNEVAEYLIDQLGINVQYAADLHEFRLRSKNPLRHQQVSCRDLAYNKDMMGLVDLIDMISDDVTPNVKRYLKDHLQTRLNVIHQAYLKRLEEQNKHLLFQLNEEKEKEKEKETEKENTEFPTVNITDQNMLPPSSASSSSSSASPSILPPIIHRPYKSHIEETIQSIDATTKDKTFDVTGKKTFRFSNYTLRFRRIETPDIDNKNKEQSQLKTTIPSLPTISLFTPSSIPLTTTNNSYRSISEASSRLSIQDTRASVCRSARRTTLPQIIPIENKPAMTPSTKRFLPKRVNRNNIKYTYIPQQQHTLYNRPRNFMPVTLKSTAIGLPSDTRIIRD